MSEDEAPRKIPDSESSIWRDAQKPDVIRRIVATLKDEAVELSATSGPDAPAAASSDSEPEAASPATPVIASQLISRQDAGRQPESSTEPPWTLQQFFNGEIDLDVELSKRFPTMPMMSNIKFRTLGTRTGRRVATLSSQDSSASVIIDADVATKVIQMSFTLGSMLTLRFALDDLNSVDQTRWLELMQREQGGLAFLWGPERWSRDYLICIARRYYTNLYAFSPHHFEAAIRLTPDVTKSLLSWLDEVWGEEDDPDSSPPELLTW